MLSERRAMIVTVGQTDRQLSQNGISADEMYLTICVEWADDHCGLGLL